MPERDGTTRSPLVALAAFASVVALAARYRGARAVDKARHSAASRPCAAGSSGIDIGRSRLGPADSGRLELGGHFAEMSRVRHPLGDHRRRILEPWWRSAGPIPAAPPGSLMCSAVRLSPSR